MIWKHYGALILNTYLQQHSLESEDINKLVDKIYFSMILELDANDNGISNVEGGKRNYWDNLNLSSIIASCNGNTTNDEEQDENFKKSMSIVTQILEIKFNDIIESYVRRYPEQWVWFHERWN